MLSSTYREESAWNSGFTLLEILIVLAVISILSALAYTSYQHVVLKARRLDAQTTLLHYHTQMQKCFISEHDFTSCTSNLNLLNPQNSFEGFYLVQVVSSEVGAYALQAITQGSQQKDEDCYRFTINHRFEQLAFDAYEQENNQCW